MCRGDVGGVRREGEGRIGCLEGVFMVVELAEFGVIGGVLKARLAIDGRRGVDIVKKDPVEAVVYGWYEVRSVKPV